uniref:O-acyltransferase n=1 Tax=Mesocestoides corti TaxID=53468 RepID=A0A5K3F428_MESCO
TLRHPAQCDLALEARRNSAQPRKYSQCVEKPTEMSVRARDLHRITPGFAGIELPWHQLIKLLHYCSPIPSNH